MRAFSKFSYLGLIIILLLLSSCLSTTSSVANQDPKIKNKDSFITIDELLIDDNPNEKGMIEIYKSDLIIKCERKYHEIIDFYNAGDLLPARIQFDNLLETLEIIYGDEKVGDSVMLQDFLKELSKDNKKDFEIDLFELYKILYGKFNLAATDENTLVEIAQEKTPKNEVVSVEQNNKEYLYLKNQTKKILGDKTKLSSDFMKEVYELYQEYLQDKQNLNETYIRFSKYDKFLNKVLKEANLDENYRYIPATVTSYRIKKNGGIWGLGRTHKKIRDDVGASTGYVLNKIKKTKHKNNPAYIISSVVSERDFSFKSSFSEKDILNNKLADFLALSIILKNPKKHDLKKVASKDQSAKYLKAYYAYLKNPQKYKPKKSSHKKQKSNSKYEKIKYTIRKGDNLSLIASLFEVSVKDLKRWNPRTTSKKFLPAGSALWIRGYHFRIYKAKNGDSIAKICNKFKMKQSQFKKINNLKRNTIFRGRRYYVKKR